MDIDQQLLSDYARNGSEPAFRELVGRHINMVHSAALREARGDVSLAEDITQDVFAELARRAARLSSHPVLAGWLYTCVRLTTANIRRANTRRQRREQEAFTMNELLGPNPADQLWQQVRPVLDDVMHELDDEDRTAVVLRFFEGRSLKEVGTAIGLTENAARMRVERSLEKLHGLLSRRGINSTATTLAVVLVAGTVVSVSSAFAGSVATGALATAAAAGGSVAPLFPKLLALAKTKTAAAAALAIVAVGLFLWHNSHQSTAPTAAASSTLGSAAGSVIPNGPAGNDAAVPLTASTNGISSSQMAFQLLDAESGAPLPGAKLHLFYLFRDGRGKTVKTVTDAKGQAALDMPQPPYRALNFFVTADGHVPLVTSWGFRRPMPAAYTMRLARGVTIGGKVVDDAGHPIVGAQIKIEDPGNDSSLAENIQFVSDATVTTGPGGQWSCNMIPAGWDEVSLTVLDTNHAETNATVRPKSSAANQVVITMSAGLSVTGTVQDLNGHPIPGAKIRQVRFNSENEHTQNAGPSGAFDLRGLAPGEQTLAVQADGFAPAVQTLQLVSNVPSLRLQLGPGHVLRGRITDGAGNPVADAFIETTRQVVDKIKWSTNTDADGRFEWNSAPPEPLLYSVLAEGFDPAYGQSLPADGSDHDLKLSPSHPDKDTIQITGTVADAETGRPLDDFKVFTSDLDPDWVFPLEFITTGQNGKFNLSLSTNSNHSGYRVQIEKDGYLPAVSADLLRTGGNQQLDLKLLKGSGPAGVVLLPNGQPAVNATALLCTSLSGVTLGGAGSVVEKGLNTTTYTAPTDVNGKFSLPPAVSPLGVIIVHDQGFLDISPAQLAVGGTVTLNPWGGVKGQLVLDSRPAANERIVAANQVVRYTDTGRAVGYLTYRFEATTDAEGKFSFDKVPPGPCRVFVERRAANTIYASHGKLLDISSGVVTQVELGGSGQSVLGRAVLPDSTAPVDWRNSPVVLRGKIGAQPGPAPKRADFPTLEAFIAASESRSQAYQHQQSFVALCQPDGSFVVPDVPAGTYEMRISANDVKANSATPHDPVAQPELLGSLVRDVVVPDADPSATLDLGTLQLASPPKTAPAP